MCETGTSISDFKLLEWYRFYPFIHFPTKDQSCSVEFHDKQHRIVLLSFHSFPVLNDSDYTTFHDPKNIGVSSSGFSSNCSDSMNHNDQTVKNQRTKQLKIAKLLSHRVRVISSSPHLILCVIPCSVSSLIETNNIFRNYSFHLTALKENCWEKLGNIAYFLPIGRKGISQVR